MRLRRPIERPLVLAAALFVATWAWRLVTFTGFTNDHYAHLALAQQMLLGDRPVRDFSDPGWPLTYLISAAAWRAAGSAMWVEWAVTTLAFALGAACTALAAARLSGSTAIALVVTAIEIVISPRTYAYPKILPYAVLAWLITTGHGPSRGRLVLLGTLIATAFLLRHDHGLWIGTAAVVYVWLAGWKDGRAAAVGRIAVVAATAAALVLPWLLFVAMNGGVLAYFSTAVEFARAEANASTLRAWPRFGTGTNAEAWLFWLFWAIPAASAVLAVRRWRRDSEGWPGQAAAVGALVVLAICVNAGFLRDLLRTRFADAVVPASVLGAWLLGAVWMRPWRRPAAQHAAQVVSLCLVAATIAALAQFPEVRDRLERSTATGGFAGLSDRVAENVRILRLPHRQTLMPPGRVSAVLMPFFEYLDRCTSPAERLIVTGENPDVVVLAGRRFGGDGVVFGAWYSSAARQDRTLQLVRGRTPLFAVLLDEAGFRDRFPLIAQYVGDTYRPFATLQEDGIDVPILVHESRAAGGTDAATGWPCFR